MVLGPYAVCSGVLCSAPTLLGPSLPIPPPSAPSTSPAHLSRPTPPASLPANLSRSSHGLPVPSPLPPFLPLPTSLAAMRHFSLEISSGSPCGTASCAVCVEINVDGISACGLVWTWVIQYAAWSSFIRHRSSLKVWTSRCGHTCSSGRSSFVEVTSKGSLEPEARIAITCISPKHGEPISVTACMAHRQA